MNTEDCAPPVTCEGGHCSDLDPIDVSSLQFDGDERQKLYEALREMALTLNRIEGRLNRLETSLSKWV